MFIRTYRAGDGIRTREYQLGRLMPYHLATPATFQATHEGSTLIHLKWGYEKSTKLLKATQAYVFYRHYYSRSE